MSRYIDAEKIEYSWLPLAAMPDQFVTKKRIDEMPTADVASVRHAHWVKSDFGDGIFECSDCHKAGYTKKFEYCPDCGAKMDEENEE